MRLVERRHDVSSIGVGEKVERHCDNCHDVHEFSVFIALPGGMKVGSAACPKAAFGSYSQIMNVDHVPEDPTA